MCSVYVVRSHIRSQQHLSMPAVKCQTRNNDAQHTEQATPKTEAPSSPLPNLCTSKWQVRAAHPAQVARRAAWRWTRQGRLHPGAPARPCPRCRPQPRLRPVHSLPPAPAGAIMCPPRTPRPPHRRSPARGILQYCTWHIAILMSYKKSKPRTHKLTGLISHTPTTTVVHSLPNTQHPTSLSSKRSSIASHQPTTPKTQEVLHSTSVPRSQAWLLRQLLHQRL